MNLEDIYKSEKTHHFYFDSVMELASIISKFRDDTTIEDNMEISIDVPHEFFRNIQSSLDKLEGNTGPDTTTDLFLMWINIPNSFFMTSNVLFLVF